MQSSVGAQEKIIPKKTEMQPLDVTCMIGNAHTQLEQDFKRVQHKIWKAEM